jgi:endoribonuclease L-PSP, putative
MSIKTISTSNAPAAIGPYSQAKLVSLAKSKTVGSLLFTSGAVPLDPVSGEVVGTDITAQAHQTIKNLLAVLKASGAGAEDVIKTTCFIKNMADFADFNAVYAEYFTGNPARSCVEVARLPRDVLCEIEAVAVV